MRDLRLLLRLPAPCLLATLLIGCPTVGDGNGFSDDDDLIGVDDDDSAANDDDATGDDDDATGDDDDATGDDDDATGDDDDATGDDDDDATGDDDDATGDDDDATSDDDDATGDDDDATMSGPGGPVVFLTGIGCGFSVSATTIGFNNNAWGYPACSLGDSGWDSGEYVITLGQPGTVTLDLSWSDPTIDLDLIVLDGGDVSTSGCYGSSASSSGSSEQVIFTLGSGQVAWIVVDGKGGDEGPFSLNVTCN
ncbi:MAG: hypothetical protein KDA24_10035 [Deltaproteobacteria bacterium]|nr:hypothetical protein [Deltaproteobacteria bacterium]